MWFKSKTQHSDPDVRRRYVEQLPNGDEVLVTVALEDPHPDVRSAAVARLLDLPTLHSLSADDPDPQIRARSTARLQTVMAGDASQGIPLTDRLAFLRKSANQRLYRFLARSGTEPELRKDALTLLLDTAQRDEIADLLCDIAVEDSVNELREFAAAQLDDEAHLAALVQRSKGHAKSIYRNAQARLEKLQAAKAGLAALEACRNEARQLAGSNLDLDPSVAEARLNSLKTTWATHRDAVGTALSTDVQNQFEEAVTLCEKHFKQRREEKKERRVVLDALRAYLAEQTDESPVALLSKRWHTLGVPTPGETREFDRLVHEAHELHSQRDRDLERVAAANKLLAACEKALTAERLAAKDLKRLEKRWEGLTLPDDAQQKSALTDQYKTAHQKLQNRLQEQEQALEAKIATAAEHLDVYEQALKDERLKDVLSVHDKTASLLNRLPTGEPRIKVLWDRLKAGEPRMSELKRWRHWGTVRAREQLCERAEALPDAGLTPPKMARAVRDCRDAWKALDKADGAASKALWERFDSACEKAYEPCQAYFDEQKRGRQNNMAARTAICVQLETLGSETDWDNPPWRELADTMRDIQRKWQRTGAVDRREKSAIEKRYKAASAVIDNHLEAMRQRELERRQGLIARIEALGTEDDINSAVRQVKLAQRDWKPVVQADRRKERELWKQFRTACDAVFDKRKVQFEQADQERLQHLAEKKSVCTQVEEILATLKTNFDAETYDSELVSETRQKIAALRNGWQRIGPVPRDQEKDIEARVRNAANSVLQLCDDIDVTLQRRSLEQLRKAAQQCDAWELAIAQGETVDVQAVEQQLNDLGDSASSKALRRRLRDLKAAATGDDSAQSAIAAALDKNLEAKRTICLELEIATGIESPPEFQQQRMAYRVNQLSASLSGQGKQRDPEQLQQDWYATGAVPAAEHEAIDKRFQRVVKALGAD